MEKKVKVKVEKHNVSEICADGSGSFQTGGGPTPFATCIEGSRLTFHQINGGDTVDTSVVVSCPGCIKARMFTRRHVTLG